MKFSSVPWNSLVYQKILYCARKFSSVPENSLVYQKNSLVYQEIL
jgi:hypothetical protein